MLNKEKVREVLQELYNHAYLDADNDRAGVLPTDRRTIDDFVTALESLLEKEQDGARWVSCAERLPKLNQEVLVYRSEYLFGKSLGPCKRLAYRWNDGSRIIWCDHDIDLTDDRPEYEPTHWLENLPALPKTEGTK